jgi:hypothetical protein
MTYGKNRFIMQRLKNSVSQDRKAMGPISSGGSSSLYVPSICPKYHLESSESLRAIPSSDQSLLTVSTTNDRSKDDIFTQILFQL